PSSYNRTEDAASAALPGRGMPREFESVIRARPAEDDGAERSGLFAAKEMDPDFFRPMGMGAASVDGTKTISLRTVVARDSVSTTGSTMSSGAGRQVTPR